jgi:hypothetical protein
MDAGIAFDRGQEGAREIWIVRFDGDGLRRVAKGGDNHGPSWVRASGIKPFLGPPAKPVPPLAARLGRSTLLTHTRCAAR